MLCNVVCCSVYQGGSGKLISKSFSLVLCNILSTFSYNNKILKCYILRLFSANSVNLLIALNPKKYF